MRVKRVAGRRWSNECWEEGERKQGRGKESFLGMTRKEKKAKASSKKT